jgi:hypothetical protein
MKLEQKIIATTFVLFMAEAIIHYNFGKKDCEKKTTKGILPPTNSLIRIGVVVGVFSVINGMAIKTLK